MVGWQQEQGQEGGEREGEREERDRERHRDPHEDERKTDTTSTVRMHVCGWECRVGCGCQVRNTRDQVMGAPSHAACVYDMYVHVCMLMFGCVSFCVMC